MASKKVVIEGLAQEGAMAAFGGHGTLVRLGATAGIAIGSYLITRLLEGKPVLSLRRGGKQVSQAAWDTNPKARYPIGRRLRDGGTVLFAYQKKRLYDRQPSPRLDLVIGLAEGPLPTPELPDGKEGVILYLDGTAIQLEKRVLREDTGNWPSDLLCYQPREKSPFRGGIRLIWNNKADGTQGAELTNYMSWAPTGWKKGKLLKKDEQGVQQYQMYEHEDKADTEDGFYSVIDPDDLDDKIDGRWDPPWTKKHKLTGISWAHLILNFSSIGLSDYYFEENVVNEADERVASFNTATQDLKLSWKKAREVGWFQSDPLPDKWRAKKTPDDTITSSKGIKEYNIVPSNKRKKKGLRITSVPSVSFEFQGIDRLPNPDKNKPSASTGNAAAVFAFLWTEVWRLPYSSIHQPSFQAAYERCEEHHAVRLVGDTVFTIRPFEVATVLLSGDSPIRTMQALETLIGGKIAFQNGQVLLLPGRFFEKQMDHPRVVKTEDLWREPTVVSSPNTSKLRNTARGQLAVCLQSKKDEAVSLPIEHDFTLRQSDGLPLIEELSSITIMQDWFQGQQLLKTYTQLLESRREVTLSLHHTAERAEWLVGDDILVDLPSSGINDSIFIIESILYDPSKGWIVSAREQPPQDPYAIVSSDKFHPFAAKGARGIPVDFPVPVVVSYERISATELSVEIKPVEFSEWIIVFQVWPGTIHDLSAIITGEKEDDPESIRKQEAPADIVNHRLSLPVLVTTDGVTSARPEIYSLEGFYDTDGILAYPFSFRARYRTQSGYVGDWSDVFTADPIEVVALPDVPQPTRLLIFPETRSARIIWRAIDFRGFEKVRVEWGTGVAVGKNSILSVDTHVDNIGNYYEIDELLEETDYWVRVRFVNTEDDEGAWTSGRFTTKATPQASRDTQVAYWLGEATPVPTFVTQTDTQKIDIDFLPTRDISGGTKATRDLQEPTESHPAAWLLNRLYSTDPALATQWVAVSIAKRYVAPGLITFAQGDTTINTQTGTRTLDPARPQLPQATGGDGAISYSAVGAPRWLSVDTAVQHRRVSLAGSDAVPLVTHPLIGSFRWVATDKAGNTGFVPITVFVKPPEKPPVVLPDAPDPPTATEFPTIPTDNITDTTILVEFTFPKGKRSFVDELDEVDPVQSLTAQVEWGTTDSEGTFEQVGIFSPLDQGKYLIRDLEPSTPYVIRLRYAVQASAYSTAFSRTATTKAATRVGAPGIPTATEFPAISADNITDTSIRVNYTLPSTYGLTAQVEWGTAASGGGFSRRVGIAAGLSDGPYIIRDLDPSTTYVVQLRYRVQSSPLSDARSRTATTKAAPTAIRFDLSTEHLPRLVVGQAISPSTSMQLPTVAALVDVKAYSILHGALPPGLTLSTTTAGRVTGTPTRVGNYSVLWRVIDGGRSAELSRTLAVHPAPVVQHLQQCYWLGGTDGVVGKLPAQTDLQKTNEDYLPTFDGRACKKTVGELPSPTQALPAIWLVARFYSPDATRATDWKLEHIVDRYQAPAPSPLVFGTRHIPSLAQGEAVDTTIPFQLPLVKGDQDGVTYGILYGSLPGGLTLSKATPGRITGTPTKKGLFRITWQASKGAQSIEEDFTIYVASPPPAKVPAPGLPTATEFPAIDAANCTDTTIAVRFTLPSTYGLTAQVEWGTAASGGGFDRRVGIAAGLGDGPYIIRGLEPNTTYVVQLRYRVQSSPLSDARSRTATTKAALVPAVPDAPMGVSVSTWGDTALRVLFDPSSLYRTRIQWGLATSSSFVDELDEVSQPFNFISEVFLEKGAKGSFIISGLQPQTEYEVRVSHINDREVDGPYYGEKEA